jgi:hypothetical protein
MAARILAFPNPGTLPRAVDGGRFRNISGTSAGQGLPSNCATDMESRANAEGLGCIRGTTLMLVAEALGGLGIYAVWHLLRLLH